MMAEDNGKILDADDISLHSTDDDKLWIKANG